MSSTHELHDGPNRFQPLEYPQTLTSPLSSITLAYGVLSLILVYQTLKYLNDSFLPASEILWNVLVHITPLRLVSALDSRAGPKSTAGQKTTATISRPQRYASKSEAMRHILGLDGVGILETVQRTKSLPGLGSLFHRRQSSSPPGLGNWDNSCYQNSVIQGLASLSSVLDFLRRIDGEENPCSTRTALKDIISELKEPKNTGKLMWTPPGLKSMSSWQQQDAQEYFSKVVDEVDREILNLKDGKAKYAGLEMVAELQVPKMTSNNTSGETRTRDRILTGKVSGVDQLPEELGSMIVRSPLEGLLAQRVGCLTCGYVEGLSLIPFNCLTVPLGKQWMYDVRTCLDEYTKLEPINGVECTKCTLLHYKNQLERLRARSYKQDTGDTCPLIPPLSEALLSSAGIRLSAINSILDDGDFSETALMKTCQIPARSRISTTKSRQAVVARAPQSLVIHVNRSVFNDLTGVQSKNLANVRFPLHFDLATWCLGNLSSKSDASQGEIWNVDPSTSMLPIEIDAEEFRPQEIYELRAVITHYGRHENGHYICYRRHPSISQAGDKPVASWWRFSDEEVTQVSEENVLSQGGVFMLFYEKSNFQESKEGQKGAAAHSISTAVDDPERVEIDHPIEDSAIDVGGTQNSVLVDESASITTLTETPTEATASTNLKPALDDLPPAQASAILSESSTTTTVHSPADLSLLPSPPTHQSISALAHSSEPLELCSSINSPQSPNPRPEIYTANPLSPL